jgi:hypothetical protein
LRFETCGRPAFLWCACAHGHKLREQYGASLAGVTRRKPKAGEQ